MRLTSAYRAFLLLFAGAGAFVAVSGLQLKYYGVLGPGAGFLPVWVGSLLCAACLAALLQSLLEGACDQMLFETRDAALRVLQVMLALAALWFGMRLLGFRLSMLAFVLLVPRVFGPQPVVRHAAVALLLSLGVGQVFEKWLGVALPPPAFEALAALGL